MTNAAYEPTIAKLQRLPESLVQEVDAFIDFLQMRVQSQTSVWQALSVSTESSGVNAEDGMDTYLHKLEAYEDLLAAGKKEGF